MPKTIKSSFSSSLYKRPITLLSSGPWQMLPNGRIPTLIQTPEATAQLRGCIIHVISPGLIVCPAHAAAKYWHDDRLVQLHGGRSPPAGTAILALPVSDEHFAVN